mmetsp:Transcript_120771/g.301342  ORF Transcript_120771/g.301342 Transcript_120771/m.301342 type:complete len:146 (-) Transcript_120771:447-884(-)
MLNLTGSQRRFEPTAAMVNQDSIHHTRRWKETLPAAEQPCGDIDMCGQSAECIGRAPLSRDAGLSTCQANNYCRRMLQWYGAQSASGIYGCGHAGPFAQPTDSFADEQPFVAAWPTEHRLRQARCCDADSWLCLQVRAVAVVRGV